MVTIIQDRLSSMDACIDNFKSKVQQKLEYGLSIRHDNLSNGDPMAPDQYDNNTSSIGETTRDHKPRAIGGSFYF